MQTAIFLWTECMEVGAPDADKPQDSPPMSCKPVNINWLFRVYTRHIRRTNERIKSKPGLIRSLAVSIDLGLCPCKSFISTIQWYIQQPQTLMLSCCNLNFLLKVTFLRLTIVGRNKFIVFLHVGCYWCPIIFAVSLSSTRPSRSNYVHN